MEVLSVVLMEVERFNGKAKADEQGAVALVLDLAKAFWASQPSCGVGLGDALQLPEEDVAGAVRPFRAPEACTVRRMCGRADHDRHCYLARVQMALFALTYCAPGCAG